LTQLKQIVKSVDENAFIIINDSVEVRGKGFQALEETSFVAPNKENGLKE
jgi:hypothetical protein